MMVIQPEQVKRVLAREQDKADNPCPPLPGIQPGPIYPAAVLIPLLEADDGWKMLFIKRTLQQNDRHSGQIAFPGGRAEEGDPTLLATALREAQEEIGVAPVDIQILGQSCPITTVTDYQVSPFVGILPWPYQLTLSPLEVEKTLLIPLDWLNDPRNREIRSWRSRSAPGQKLPVIFYREYQGEVLWGATARIVLDFLDLIGTAS